MQPPLLVFFSPSKSPFVYVGINYENNQLCGVYSRFIETKIKTPLKHRTTMYVQS